MDLYAMPPLSRASLIVSQHLYDTIMAGFADIHQSAVSVTQFHAEDGNTPLSLEISSGGSASTCIECQALTAAMNDSLLRLPAGTAGP